MLDETLGLDRPQLAVMTLLLLRGPQTPGELKTRSARLYPFGSLAEVEAVLARLAGPDHGLVANLRPAAGSEGIAVGELLTPHTDSAEAAATSPTRRRRPLPGHDVADARTGGRCREPAPARAFTPSPPSAQPIPVRNPATGAVIREIEVDSAASVEAKVRRARDAQPGMGRPAVRRPGRRAARLRRRARTSARRVRGDHDVRDRETDHAGAQRDPRRARAGRVLRRTGARRSPRRDR